MNNKIEALTRQLSPNEQRELADHIERQYAVEVQSGMLRDDIKDGLLEFMQDYFELSEPPLETETLESLDLGSSEFMYFINFHADYFKIKEVAFATVKEWCTIKEVIDYIEHNQEIPYISGFEPEA